MPDRSRCRLVFGLKSSNHAVEFSHQLGFFRDNGIDVQNSIRAGDGDIPPSGVESDMFGSLGLLTEVFDLRDVFDVDNLDCQFTSCCQLPYALLRPRKGPYSLATAIHSPSFEIATSRTGKAHRTSSLSILPDSNSYCQTVPSSAPITNDSFCSRQPERSSKKN